MNSFRKQRSNIPEMQPAWQVVASLKSELLGMQLRGQRTCRGSAVVGSDHLLPVLDGLIQDVGIRVGIGGMLRRFFVFNRKKLGIFERSLQFDQQLRVFLCQF